jgi:septation ring formation regulator
MIKYTIIVVVVLLLAALIAGMIMRRKHQSVVTRLESDKLQIQHYPIFEELTKLKSLNMNGQTEEMFEKWRNNWTEVIDVDILKINSLLFDLEDCIDRFQFKKAKAIEKEIEGKIKKCEARRADILKELEELIGSEEKNRIEMEQLKDYYRSARKTVLAHQHSFGPALPLLEDRLADFNPAFHKFDELTEQGDYLEAREIVLKLNAEAQAIYTLLSDIPGLLGEIQTKIPASIQDLRNGQREMEEQKYYLVHLELQEFLDKTENELKELKVRLSNLEVDYVRERVVQILNEIDGYYDLLEKEVHAKAFVDKHITEVHTILQQALSLTKEVHEEVQFVQNSYRISDEEVDIPKSGLKTLESVQKRFELLVTRIEQEQSAYSSLQEDLTAIKEEVGQVQELQEEFSNSLKNLRIDENKARTELEGIKKLLTVTDRQLHKANIPGIPDEIDARMEEAEEKIFIVMQSLQEIPLNMDQVNLNIVIARRSAEDIHKRVEEMIENVMLIESLIQFGNRYRATNRIVDEKLLEAEEAFLQYRYVKALEEAASAVEMIDPTAINRIEQLVQEQLTVKS